MPAIAAAQREPVYVGLLEDDRSQIANWEPGVATRRLIRPSFVKQGNNWTLAPNLEAAGKLHWIVAFDGKTLGEVESQPIPSTAEHVSHLLEGMQILLTEADRVPTVGKPSQQFAGILGEGPALLRRPLVVVNQPSSSDPDGWKRGTLPKDIVQIVQTAFRHEFPHVRNCDKDEGPVLPNDWQFPNSDIEVTATYSSNKSSFLVETQLKHGQCGWVDDPDDPFADQWFFVAKDRSCRRIGAFMTLLDAGDYDGDGKSEVIFFMSQGENTDGYVFFSDDFKHRIERTWHYH
jgi:hypothetical protein